MTNWEAYKCECGRKYAISQNQGNELEEPACPECGGTNSEVLLNERLDKI
ncbi:hypothetical protein GCM10008014_08570 [Paenibacillus silvae]|uniref:Zinc ribbon domain-containing protein n=1 Tax=Paenibacillus silvae TaxID=1325358 RepID=A0ABQ1Z300_9BACL|nr:hypothetical protein GCM10008014_08570 [Paenibacillus silvae]